jgi:signal transduction histidine kinase
VSGVTRDDLRRIDLFEGLDDARLDAWLAVAQEGHLTAGERVAEPGEPSPGLLLLLEGSFQDSIVDGARVEPIKGQQAPTWTGAISALSGEAMLIRIDAATDCRVAVVEPGEFRRLAFAQQEVLQRVLHQMSPVHRYLARVEHRREHLEALGTMAAGLAHELNNPAAAARQAAAELAETVRVVNATLGEFVAAGLERPEAEQLAGLQRKAVVYAARGSALDALDAADAEDEVRAELEAHGVQDAWRLAEPLARAGFNHSLVERTATLAGPATGAALRWFAASVTAEQVARDLAEATGRMSALVGAVKRYAHDDPDDMVPVDVNDGIETTLTVLAHRLKGAGVEVVRDYDRELPRVPGRASELTQVWTNLLTNALDAVAVDGGGKVTVATRAEPARAQVVVTVSDDGPGIDPAAAERIFEPFFTTKDVGDGTGLGLSTARRIAADRHGGDIRVESSPGHTAFTVRLPMNTPSAGGPR